MATFIIRPSSSGQYARRQMVKTTQHGQPSSGNADALAVQWRPDIAGEKDRGWLPGPDVNSSGPPSKNDESIPAFYCSLLWKLNNTCKRYHNGNILHLRKLLLWMILCLSQTPLLTCAIICEFLQITGMFFNSSKSAYTFSHCESNFNPKFNEELFKILDTSKCYKYLGVQPNLNLDWTTQLNVTETAVCLTINTIIKKFYLNPSSLVQLINMVALPMTAYCMQVIQFDKVWINKLHNYITYALNRAIAMFYSFLAWRNMVLLFPRDKCLQVHW